jgi:DNA-binding MarR family transcriptional regulator
MATVTRSAADRPSAGNDTGQHGKFIMLPHVAVRSLSRIRPTVLAVFAALLMHRNQKTGLCNPTVPTLAADVGLSHETVERAIGELERAGFVSVERHKDRRGHFYSLAGTHAKVECSTHAKVKCSGVGTHAKTPSEHTQKPARNKEEQDVLTRRNTKPSGTDVPVDHRHTPIRELIKQQHQDKFKTGTCEWDGSEARALSQILKANPKWDVEVISAMVRNRFDSDGVTPARPRTWIPALGKYAAGPLNEFNRLKVPKKPKAQEDFEARALEVGRILREQTTRGKLQ